MNVIAEHLRAQEPGLVLWLACTEELCEQAVQEFLGAWRVLRQSHAPRSPLLGTYELELRDAKDGLVVCGLPKMVAAAKQDIGYVGTLASRASLLIIDEAHQAIAPTYRLILDALFNFSIHSSLLGLTATPGRTWSDIDADAKLSSFFGRRKVMLKVDGYENPVNYLIQEGYLAKPNFRPLFHDSGNGLSPTDRARIEDAFDIPQDILDKLADDERRNLLILTEAGKLLGSAYSGFTLCSIGAPLRPAHCCAQSSGLCSRIRHGQDASSRAHAVTSAIQASRPYSSHIV